MTDLVLVGRECQTCSMGARTRYLSNALCSYGVLMSSFLALSRLLVLDEEDGEEEEEEGGGLVGSYAPRPQATRGLLPHEKAYLSGVDELAAAYSRTARIRLRRFYALSVTALACASSVPVAVAAGAPGWAVAALGAAAAVAQGSEQLLRDQRLSAETHAMAVLLSQQIRRFRYRFNATSKAEQRAIFERFVEEVEGIHETQGTALVELMRHAPSLERS